MWHRSTAAVAALGSGLAGYILFARPWFLGWGATGSELDGYLPGDEDILDADLTATRALTVRSSAEQVWPWIAQLGQGRGGFYSYDLLENLVGCDIHSADRIEPGWQEVRVGDEVKLAPQVGLAVVSVETGKSLVLRGGVPVGKAPPPYDFTWAFVLHDQPDGTSRLLVRERYAYTRRWARLLVEPIQVVSFVMTQRMLRGVKDRAEQAATSVDA